MTDFFIVAIVSRIFFFLEFVLTVGMYQNTLWGIFSFIHISSNSPTRQKSTEADRRAQCYNHQNLDNLRIEIENYIVLFTYYETK